MIPFIFITIACGALSGFHATIGTGTTPKMIANEKDVLFVGYGAMLTEGFVAVMALIAACVLVPADYFAINSAADKFAELGMTVQNLPMLEAEVQENLAARPGGSVSLAVGMAYIFSRIPWMEDLMAYWYHFAIMFEAVFILSAVDAGTRVGRFFLQEMVGKVIPKFADHEWVPGIAITSAIFTGLWGYLVYSGDISTIWPLFGICNQLLASVTLLIGTTVLLRLNKTRYAWMTGIPGCADDHHHDVGRRVACRLSVPARREVSPCVPLVPCDGSDGRGDRGDAAPLVRASEDGQPHQGRLRSGCEADCGRVVVFCE